jgi:hypothetical protein
MVAAAAISVLSFTWGSIVIMHSEPSKERAPVAGAGVSFISFAIAGFARQAISAFNHPPLYANSFLLIFGFGVGLCLGAAAGRWARSQS